MGVWGRRGGVWGLGEVEEEEKGREWGVGTRGEKGNGMWGWKKGRREGRAAVMLALGPRPAAAPFLIRSHGLKAQLAAFVSMEIKP